MRVDGTLKYDSGCSDDSCRHANVSPEAAANPGSSRRSRFRPWPSAEALDCTEIEKKESMKSRRCLMRLMFLLCSLLTIQFYDFFLLSNNASFICKSVSFKITRFCLFDRNNTREFAHFRFVKYKKARSYLNRLPGNLRKKSIAHGWLGACVIRRHKVHLTLASIIYPDLIFDK